MAGDQEGHRPAVQAAGILTRENCSGHENQVMGKNLNTRQGPKRELGHRTLTLGHEEQGRSVEYAHRRNNELGLR